VELTEHFKAPLSDSDPLIAEALADEKHGNKLRLNSSHRKTSSLEPCSMPWAMK